MPKPSADKSNIAKRRQQALKSGDPEYQKRRNQLFEAAGEIFRRKGFDGASMNDFAQAVGVDRASIYYYISGKEELFQQVVSMAVRENVAMVESVSSSNQEPEAKIRGFIVGLMKTYSRHYPYLYLYVQEDMARVSNKNSAWAREMKTLAERFDAAMVNIIEEGMASGSIRREGLTARMTGLAIVGMCNWSHRWYNPQGKLTAEDIGERFSDIVLSGILHESRSGNTTPEDA